MGKTGFLERVGEWVMADVMEERGNSDLEVLRHAAGEMIGPQGVLEARMRGSRVNQEGVAELPHIAQALKRRRIDDCEGLGLEADVVPERVANDLELTQILGPASRTADETAAANCSKFFRNRPASFFACAS